MTRFSIITPVYDPPADVLRAMLRSVRSQTFQDWEHCLVDDGSPSPHVRKILDKAARKDPRVKVSYRATNGGIVDASNDALAMAQGEFVVLVDHDDEIHPDALAKVDAALTAEPDTDYVYTDEDKIDQKGNRSNPFHKPGWSPERLRTQMYTCHMSVLRRSLVNTVGGFDADYEGSQDWDLVLRVTEQARGVVHIPEVLYHWRMLDSSTAAQGEAAKPYAYLAGQRAIQAHCERTGFPATVSLDPDRSGVYHLEPELTGEPRVSVIIPTAGTRRRVRGAWIMLVTHCVRSIVETSTYQSYEIVCVADTSTPTAVQNELRRLAGDRLRMVMFDRPFNFSEKINVGAIHSAGDHLLLLNDDIEVITPNWIERLVMYSQTPGIGAVGAKLLYDDGRLQHAGVMLRDTQPGHIYHGFRGDYDGYANAVRVAGNYSAVTGACLMTSRDLFEEVGGLATALPLSYNDVDYCLKVGAQGQRVVYDPDTVLYHFESSSRSPAVSEWELKLLLRRWRQGGRRDPYDNPNFTTSIHMVPSA